MRTHRSLFLTITGAVLSLLVFTGCTSLPIDTYQFQGEKTLVSTTFDEIPPEIAGLKPAMLEEGVLVMQAERREPVAWQLEERITRKTRISFRLKTGDTVDDDYPKIMIYMLRRGSPDSYVALQFDDQVGTRFIWRTENADTNEEITSRRFAESTWYNIEILLNGDTLSLYVDGTEIGSGYLPEFLPTVGLFRMETYNEASIDDLRILTFDNAVALEEGKRDADPVDVGIVMPDAPQWRRDAEVIAEEVADAGYTTRAVYSPGDQVLQNQQIRNLIAQDVEILFVRTTGPGVESALAEAEPKKITVIAYNRLIPNSNAVDYLLTFDETVIGEMQGEMIAEALQLQQVFADDPKYLALLAGDIEDENTAILFDSAMEVLRSHVDRGALRVLGPAPKSSDSFLFNRITIPTGSAESAEFQTRNLLATGAVDRMPDAILAPTDAIAAGVIQGLKSDPRFADRENYPVITGAGGEPEALQRVEEGFQYMTVVQDPHRLASLAGSLAASLLDGLGTPEPENVRIDYEIYSNGDNQVTAYLVSPSLVRTGVQNER